MQIDGFNELPKEKRPPEMLIWDGSSSEIDKWLERVFDSKSSTERDGVVIPLNLIEG